MNTRKIVLSGLLTAIVYALQVAMAGLPNIEAVTLLFIIYTLCVPSLVPYIISVFVVLEGLTFGFGIWWVNYVYIWPLLELITWFLRKNNSPLMWAVVSGAYGLCFGALCAIPWAVTGGISAGIAYWISGIPYDILHCIGNFVLMLFLYKPISFVLKRAAVN